MNPISIELKKINGKYYMSIPEAVVEMMDWSEGDNLLVPFYDIRKKEEFNQFEKSSKYYEDEIEVKIAGHEPIKITRKQVIELLENPPHDVLVYQTAYIEYKGKKYGSKRICKRLFGHEDFNTITGERYLSKLGFPPKRIYD